ncbi:SKP1-like protein 14 [Cajanus cajan]|uniref:SKP1-like protein 14 n=1 Tax=Cajanus cajan TaxID=3821 RepID=UPI00098D80DE|nr:SKP1-like protein 14 [Cajanus cajan]
MAEEDDFWKAEWVEVERKIAEGESKPFSVALAEEKLNRLILSEGESSNTAADKQENQTNVNLKTSDDVAFEVKAWIAKEMETVQSFIDTSGDSTVVIPLPNVTSRELRHILKYCEEHRRIGDDKKALKEFDDNFMKALSPDEMKELLFAANYLNMKEFLDFLCGGIAQMLENKSVEFARDFFGIENDFTPEEEASYREANAWAFENIDDSS